MADETTLSPSLASVGDDELEELTDTLHRLREEARASDRAKMDILAVRNGDWQTLRSDLFPDDDLFQAPIIDNPVDYIARGIGEAAGILPRVTCNVPADTKQQPRLDKAAKRQKIGNGYMHQSFMEKQLPIAADNLPSFGLTPWFVDLDYERKTPVFQRLDPIGCYYTRDRFGRVETFYQVQQYPKSWLKRNFPFMASHFDAMCRTGEQKHVTMVMIRTSQKDIFATLPDKEGVNPQVLVATKNPIGKQLVVVGERPTSGSFPRGQFDDVLNPMLARNSFMRLALQVAADNANAAPILPYDVDRTNPDEAIITSNPAGVGRMPAKDLSSVMGAEQTLDQAIYKGARYSTVQGGNSDASIITGSGVQALNAGNTAAIALYKTILGDVIRQLVSIAFELDEKVFGDYKKTLNGSDFGSPYLVTYTPSKDIAGDYTCQVGYGLIEGMDYQQAGVLLATGVQQGWISREYAQKNNPFRDIDPNLEARLIANEKLNDDAQMVLSGMWSAIAQMVTQGQDPTPLIEKYTIAKDAIEKGEVASDVMAKVFAPAPAAAPADPAALAQGGPNDNPLQSLMSGAPAAAAKPSLAKVLSTIKSTGQTASQLTSSSSI